MENSELQKRVKDLRIKQGLSQEELAERTGLSLRTIQRIENGESIPRGDTLKKLSIALQSTPDVLIDWQIQEDNNMLKILSLSQLGFIVFPILGIVIPLAMWVLKKDKIKFIDSIGKKILNFQITWSIFVFVVFFIFAIVKVFHLPGSPVITFFTFLFVIILYSYILLSVMINTFRYKKPDRIRYYPAIKFLS